MLSLSPPRPRGRAARIGALAGVAALLVAAPSASAAVPPFYEPPASLPSANGTLIRNQPQPLGASVVIAGVPLWLPGKATKIMYRSTDANGLAVAVTGVYIEPTKSWTGGGPRPLVSFAEGTQGQGDTCAPSRTLQSPLVYDAGQLGAGYEVPGIYKFLDRGIAVVVTDYIGLGTPDRIHSYVDRLDMGHAVLDAARVALKVPGASVTSASPVGIYGYSQGGGAAASAAELQASYAPDVNLKATYSGAPPANLMAVLKSADGTLLTGVLGYAINGLLANNPALKPVLDANTNDAGKAALAKVAEQCSADSILSFAFQKTSSWTTSGKSAYDVVNSIPAAKAIADKQRIGTIKPSKPVMVLTGTQDDIVAHPQAKQLAVDWCAKGASVYYQPAIQWLGSGGTGLNHLGPGLLDMDKAQAWLVDRLKGSTADINNCGLVGLLP
ncbi:MAG: triacylglycerol lipase [Solirubrobacteraceae bacterium]|nr:triacylglycerol lipase [Solirubrobacteraceae bacterium]